MIAALVALAWANSPWHASYAALWQVPVPLRVGAFAFERDLRFWINDGLMDGLFFRRRAEIRREIHAGELSDLAPRCVAARSCRWRHAAACAAVRVLQSRARRAPRLGYSDGDRRSAFAIGVLVLLGSACRLHSESCCSRSP